MNFLQIAQALADELDGDRPQTIYNANIGSLSQTVRRWRQNINKAYNLVLLSLNRKNEYRETSTTFTTAQGVESYNIPAGILNIDQLTISTDPPLSIVPWPEYERYKADTLLITVSGNPTLAAIYQRKIWLYPTPDASYTVSLRGQEGMTELDQDTDIPDLPVDFHRVIQEFALYFELAYEGNPLAGALQITEDGRVTAAGGKAADAVNMLHLVKANSKNHFTEPPRMISIHEKRQADAIRRVVKG